MFAKSRNKIVFHCFDFGRLTVERYPGFPPLILSYVHDYSIVYRVLYRQRLFRDLEVVLLKPTCFCPAMIFGQLV